VESSAGVAKFRPDFSRGTGLSLLTLMLQISSILNHVSVGQKSQNVIYPVFLRDRVTFLLQHIRLFNNACALLEYMMKNQFLIYLFIYFVQINHKIWSREFEFWKSVSVRWRLVSGRHLICACLCVRVCFGRYCLHVVACIVRVEETAAELNCLLTYCVVR